MKIPAKLIYKLRNETFSEIHEFATLFSKNTWKYKKNCLLYDRTRQYKEYEYIIQNNKNLINYNGEKVETLHVTFKHLTSFHPYKEDQP